MGQKREVDEIGGEVRRTASAQQSRHQSHPIETGPFPAIHQQAGQARTLILIEYSTQTRTATLHHSRNDKNVRLTAPFEYQKHGLLSHNIYKGSHATPGVPPEPAHCNKQNRTTQTNTHILLSSILSPKKWGLTRQNVRIVIVPDADTDAGLDATYDAGCQRRT